MDNTLIKRHLKEAVEYYQKSLNAHLEEGKKFGPMRSELIPRIILDRYNKENEYITELTKILNGQGQINFSEAWAPELYSILKSAIANYKRAIENEEQQFHEKFGGSLLTKTGGQFYLEETLIEIKEIEKMFQKK